MRWLAEIFTHIRPTVNPADSDAFNNSNDENSESSAVVIHQLEYVHSSLTHDTQ